MSMIPLCCPSCDTKLWVNSDDPILNCSCCGSSVPMKDAMAANYIRSVAQSPSAPVNTNSPNDFVIQAGNLIKYQGAGVDVVIPDNVLTIGTAFSGMNIRSVFIPDSVTEITSRAFAGCKKLREVRLPKNLSKIEYAVFESCSELQSVTIPSGVTIIDRNAFDGCTALQSVVIPASVTSIELFAFRDCISLAKVVIPDGVEKINACVFYNCTSLTDVVITDTVTEIDKAAFYHCTQLINMKRPGNSVKIADDAFTDAPVLQYWRKQQDEEFQRWRLQHEQDSRKWKSMGRCTVCGGEFRGVFRKKCVDCGSVKKY